MSSPNALCVKRSWSERIESSCERKMQYTRASDARVYRNFEQCTVYHDTIMTLQQVLNPSRKQPQGDTECPIKLRNSRISQTYGMT